MEPTAKKESPQRLTKPFPNTLIKPQYKVKLQKYKGT